jgi:phosphoglycolate phosphatase-like HAD superfamily hydrolase
VVHSSFAVPRVVRAILFDLDGTLIDTMTGFADLAADVMARRHGLERAHARRRYMETSGIPFRQQLEVIAPDHIDNDAASDEFEQRKRAVCDATSMSGDTIAALERMRSAGIKLVVSSNSAQHFVDEFAARERFRFDLALGFGNGLAKGPLHVARACEVLGISREDTVFCGDSLKDGELARECGLAFVGRLGTFTREEFRRWDPAAAVIEDIPALAMLMQSRAAA